MLEKFGPRCANADEDILEKFYPHGTHAEGHTLEMFGPRSSHKEGAHAGEIWSPLCT